MFAFSAPPTAGMFAKAACVSTPGYVGYSAGIGLNFATANVDSDMPPTADIDLSSFTGITFWAMSSTSVSLHVKFPDSNTDGSDPQAACIVGGSTGSCFDAFYAPETLTATWTQYTITFATDLLQAGFGGTAGTFSGLKQTNVRQIQFENEGAATADGSAPAFQMCIGPVSFTK
jgi:hypothetical protein